MNKYNVLLGFYVSRRRKVVKVRRCAVCYRPIPKKVGSNLQKYCCEECRLTARRVKERQIEAAKVAQKQPSHAALPFKPLILSNRRPGVKAIPCSLCHEIFDAPGVYVGDSVVPNVRTCEACKDKQRKIVECFEPEAICSPLSQILDGWNWKVRSVNDQS